jgi:hypothetical protein
MTYDAFLMQSNEALMAISSVCLVDYYLAKEISDTVSVMESSGKGYGFYDLGLQEAEQGLLASIHIADFNVLATYSSKDDFESEILSYLSSVIDQDNNNLPGISSITNKIINSILVGSGSSAASISMIAYNDGDYNYFPTWHIDKTHKEELGIADQTCDDNDSQNVFIIALHGAPTLYHPINQEMRNQFNLLANETAHSYGYDKNMRYQANEGLDKLFRIETSEFASFNQGGVHKAGYLSGAIHSTPLGSERLVLIVTPGDELTINQLRSKLRC